MKDAPEFPISLLSGTKDKALSLIVPNLPLSYESSPEYVITADPPPFWLHYSKKKKKPYDHRFCSSLPPFYKQGLRSSGDFKHFLNECEYKLLSTENTKLKPNTMLH